jgi:hypothetical protein
LTFEQLEKAKKHELKARAKACFEAAQEGGRLYNTDLGRATLLEAQFYMQELDRRHDSWIAWRDLVLEGIVIALIGWEIFLGRDEGVLMDRQNTILSNLETSTETTANLLKEQLAMQYEVFVNAGYNGSGRSGLDNNSKAEIYVFGLKVGNSTAFSIRGGSMSIAEHTEGAIPLLTYYPGLLNGVPTTGSLVIPFALYLKNAAGE